MDQVEGHTIRINLPNATQPVTNTLNDAESLAIYTARWFTAYNMEYTKYYEYYKNYFTQQIAAGYTFTFSQYNQTFNFEAEAAQSALQQIYSNTNLYPCMEIPNGTNGKIYPIPDNTKFTYDLDSGLQYDYSTGLYYDPNSSYFWNGVIQKYLYYDYKKFTYLLPPESSDDHAGVQQPIEPCKEPEPKKIKPEKQNRVIISKKTVQDMKKWATILNKKKESSVSALKKNESLEEKTENDFKNINESHSKRQSAKALEEKTENDFKNINESYSKRQSAKASNKRVKFTFLRKQNLEMPIVKKNKEQNAEIVNRDRAKKIRMKYGDSKKHSSNKEENAEIVNRDRAKKIRMKYGDSKKHSSNKEENAEIVNRDRAKEIRMKYGDSKKPSSNKEENVKIVNRDRAKEIRIKYRHSKKSSSNTFRLDNTNRDSYKNYVKKRTYERYLKTMDH
ncbi:hypothetical protein FQR65_LT11976 [Abscondita terminalis]|nr:hypothetical protein FQR65_LT11976 [Abscondita terminalis]